MDEPRFKKQRNTASQPSDRNDSTASRARYERGIEELRAITSKALYQQAKDNGMVISQKGFMKRNGIGSTSLTTTNDDLFAVLNGLIKHILTTYDRQKKSKETGKRGGMPGRPRGGKSATEIKVLKARIDELEGLLETRTEESQQYLERMQKMFREFSSR